VKGVKGKKPIAADFDKLSRAKKTVVDLHSVKW